MASLLVLGPRSPAHATGPTLSPPAETRLEETRFVPTDDTFVWDRAPAMVAGNRVKLKTGSKWAGPRLGDLTALLRFVVPNGDGAIESATLRLWVENGSAHEGSVFATNSDWNERTTSYLSRPPLIGSPIAEIGPVQSYTWVDIDVTAAVDGSHVVSLAVVSASRDLAKYASKEGYRTPELVVRRAEKPTERLFSEERRFSVGDRPLHVAVAELAGDGIALAISHELDDEMSVLVSDGVGGFASSNRLAIGDGPNDAAAGDVNGDGFDDLVVVNRGSDDVSILTGDGAGGFARQAPIAVGTAPTGVALADISSDGVLDIVTANSQSGDVSVLEGDGAGGFGLAKNFSTGTEFTRDVAVADLSGDGIHDIVTANGTETISVLIGDGNGGFNLDRTYFAGANPVTVVVADYSGDGVADLAVTTGPSSSVALFRGNGVGGFFADRPVVIVSDADTTGLAVVDVSGDGLLDLVFAVQVDGQVAVALADGDGGFSEPLLFSVGDSPFGLAVADLTGDGKSDVVTANRRSGDISVLIRS